MSGGSYPMNDVEANGSKVTFSEKPTATEKKLRIAVIFLVILIIGLIIALILLATIGKKSKMEEICTDAHCVKSANFLLNSMNTSVDPCEDFYHFSCGKWISENLEGGGTRTLQAASEKLEKDFKAIFKEAKEKEGLPKSVAKIIKAFDVCMEYEGLDAENMAWVSNKSKQAGGFPLIEKGHHRISIDWADLFVKQYKTFVIDYPLSISIFSNPLDSSENVIHIAQPSLDSELPPLDRDTIYAIATTFGITRNESILKDIDDIFWLKDTVTNLSRPYSELMEDKEEYELVTIEELELMFPKVSWLEFLTDLLEDFLDPKITLTGNDKVFLRGKTFIAEIIDLFESGKISGRMLLNYGGATFMNELLTFNRMEESSLRLKLKLKQKRSSGAEVKWSQCKDFLTKTASPVLDYLYGQYRKDKTISKELIDYMVKAMEEMIDQSTWLDDSTKKAVQDKLDHMVAFLSLPPWTQDPKQLEEYFKELPEMTDIPFENTLNLKLFDTKKMIQFYGKKNDRSKWPRYAQMGGSQVNAYYVPDFNIVVIPAGIQQLPYYNYERPKFMNFGGMGLIYGHEMTHGLDESGSLRDKYGNLKNWWTEKSKSEFKERSKCFVDQYGAYEYLGTGMHVDGKKTLSENIADNGGLRQAFLGYQKWVKDHGKEKRLPGLEKYSPEQLFFVAFAESWCSSINPPVMLAYSHSDDNHAADQFRVIGSLANMKEFSEVYNCKPGSTMNPKKKCIIW